jgi:hypothetical protein
MMVVDLVQGGSPLFHLLKVLIVIQNPMLLSQELVVAVYLREVCRFLPKRKAKRSVTRK